MSKHRLRTWPHRSLMIQRDAMLKEFIREAVQMVLTGRFDRHCATCGFRFEAKHKNHFFCQSMCRKRWYAGMFVRRRRATHLPGSRRP